MRGASPELIDFLRCCLGLCPGKFLVLLLIILLITLLTAVFVDVDSPNVALRTHLPLYELPILPTRNKEHETAEEGFEEFHEVIIPVLHYVFMFTGIVELTAQVIERTATQLTVALPPSFNDVKIGSSIAVNGVCLTVVDLQKESFSFDVVGETWRRTNLGDLLVGNSVNLERPMLAGGRFEGHVVQGHVEGIATVLEWKDDGEWKQLLLELPDDLLMYVTEKGSIALDGVSLTVAAFRGNVVTIALIPHTLKITTLGSRKPGDGINVETDILAHYTLQRTHAHEKVSV